MDGIAGVPPVGAGTQADTCVEGLHEQLSVLAREHESLHERGLHQGFAPGADGFEEGGEPLMLCILE